MHQCIVLKLRQDPYCHLSNKQYLVQTCIRFRHIPFWIYFGLKFKILPHDFGKVCVWRSMSLSCTWWLCRTIVYPHSSQKTVQKLFQRSTQTVCSPHESSLILHCLQYTTMFFYLFGFLLYRRKPGRTGGGTFHWRKYRGHTAAESDKHSCDYLHPRPFPFWPS